MFRDYQVNLESMANLSTSLEGGKYSKILGKRENLMWGDLITPLKPWFFVGKYLYRGFYLKNISPALFLNEVISLQCIHILLEILYSSSLTKGKYAILFKTSGSAGGSLEFSHFLLGISKKWDPRSGNFGETRNRKPWTYFLGADLEPQRCDQDLEPRTYLTNEVWDPKDIVCAHGLTPSPSPPTFL